MNRNIISIICFLVGFFASAQKQNKSVDSILVNDGPYIFIAEDHLIEKHITDGIVYSKILKHDAFPINFTPEKSEYSGIKRIVALSDIHGQFDLAIEILINNRIVDSDLNWIFGKGHLVVVGDIFDRGPKVTETLWFMYNLEEQAKKAGGKVHMLLGNHEYMVIHKDLRYIHPKYRKACDLLNKDYDELFSNETILGRWLRSKSTILKINDNMFVHGGISPKFLEKDFDLDAVNSAMRKSLDRNKKEMKSSGFYKRYYGSSGPIWYRGYFNDNLAETQIDTILQKVDAQHMVVGHCSQERVLQLYHKKVFAVDSSIKNGRYGEVLFIDINEYARGTKSGEIIRFD